MFLRLQGSAAPASARVPPAGPRDRRSAGDIFAAAKRKDGQAIEKARDSEFADFAAAADERRFAAQNEAPGFAFLSFRFARFRRRFALSCVPTNAMTRRLSRARRRSRPLARSARIREPCGEGLAVHPATDRRLPRSGFRFNQSFD
jgi:hypothetical protein